MRTTIEIEDEHLAWLMEIVAQRGQKGFSRLVNEAIAAFLASEEEQEERRWQVVATRGALSEADAQELRQRVGDLRRSWR